MTTRSPVTKINLHEAANRQVHADRSKYPGHCGAPDLMFGGMPELMQLHDRDKEETLLFVIHADCRVWNDELEDYDWDSDDYLASDVTVLKMDGTMSIIPRDQAKAEGVPGWGDEILPWRHP